MTRSGVPGPGRGEAFGTAPLGRLDVLVRRETLVQLVDRQHHEEVQGTGESTKLITALMKAP
ncbi:hypothetical protein ACIGG5_14580 [Streptomyces sp. NPDC085463]|uniref:hypothetical protein n=1 Tax=Streptomyces sp. NPDC085463 TaxID=3365724 RepID=UPI0037D03F72